MSILGVSSYFLWTEKGMTIMPLVRGSGFCVAFDLASGFHKYHVLTAAHIVNPIRYRQIFGNSEGLNAIGERHLYARALVSPPYSPETDVRNLRRLVEERKSNITATIFLEGKKNYFPNCDVASLRCKNEAALASSDTRPFEVDHQPIQQGDDLVYLGVEAMEDKRNPHDNGLVLCQRRIEGKSEAAVLTEDYGPAVVGTAEEELPLSMCGGPVIRKSTGKCIGVIVAQVRTSPPPAVTPKPPVVDPWLDVSNSDDLRQITNLRAAFVPFAEFYKKMRQTEL